MQAETRREDGEPRAKQRSGIRRKSGKTIDKAWRTPRSKVGTLSLLVSTSDSRPSPFRLHPSPFPLPRPLAGCGADL
jgi:hypothetical protein